MRRPHTPAVPVALGQHAATLATQAGLDASDLALWTRPQYPGMAHASFRRTRRGRAPTPTLVTAESLTRAPDRDWVLAHEIAHLALGHGHPRSRPRPWLPGALVALTAPIYFLLSLLLPPPVPVLAFGLAIAGGVLDPYRRRQREYAADGYATTHLHTPMTVSAMRTIRANEPRIPRWRLLRFTRTHPLPEDRFAHSERLRTTTESSQIRSA